MAKPKSVDTSERDIHLIEAMLNLQQRGRSVVNGTVLVGADVETFAHELSDQEKLQFRELIVSALRRTL